MDFMLGKNRLLFALDIISHAGLASLALGSFLPSFFSSSSLRGGGLQHCSKKRVLHVN